jgi:hypothetical protein
MSAKGGSSQSSMGNIQYRSAPGGRLIGSWRTPSTDSKAQNISRVFSECLSAELIDDAFEFPRVSAGRLSDAVVEVISDGACTAMEVRWPVLRSYIESYLLIVPPCGESWRVAATRRSNRSGLSFVLAQVLRGVSYSSTRSVSRSS